MAAEEKLGIAANVGKELLKTEELGSILKIIQMKKQTKNYCPESLNTEKLDEMPD